MFIKREKNLCNSFLINILFSVDFRRLEITSIYYKRNIITIGLYNNLKALFIIFSKNEKILIIIFLIKITNISLLVFIIIFIVGAKLRLL